MKTVDQSQWICYGFRHCVKSVFIRSYSGPHFPAFRITPNEDNFYAVRNMNFQMFDPSGHRTKIGRKNVQKTSRTFPEGLICGALRDLVPFAQFKKREVGCFSRFLNCANGTKSRNAPHICSIYILYPGSSISNFNFESPKFIFENHTNMI